jgi:hypothetical protein
MSMDVKQQMMVILRSLPCCKMFLEQCYDILKLCFIVLDCTTVDKRDTRDQTMIEDKQWNNFMKKIYDRDGGSLPLNLCSPTSKQECYVFNSRKPQLPAPVLRTSLSGVWGRQIASQAAINADDSSLHVNSP